MSYLAYPRNLPGLSADVVRRPKHSVSVQSHQSGGEVRMAYWSEPLWEWDLSYELLRDGFRNGRSYTELKQIEGLFLACFGSLTGFQFYDPDNNTTNFPTGIGTTDGTTTTFDLVIYTGTGAASGGEHIGFVDTTEPFILYVDGVAKAASDATWGYTLATSVPMKQQLVFNAAPPSGHALTVHMSWLYYARFQSDSLDFEKFMAQLWSLKKVTLTSLRF